MNQELIWYVFIEGEQTGPHSKEAIYELLETGKVSGADFVWREGFDDWVKLESVDEFADIFDDVIVGEDDVEDFEAGQTVGGLQRGAALAEEAESEATPGDVPDFKEMEGAVDDFFASISDGVSQKPEEAPVEARSGIEDESGLSAPVEASSDADIVEAENEDEQSDAFIPGFSMAGAAKATAPKAELLEERSDDSVLFNLDALSSGSSKSSGSDRASGAPVDDGSGLIDIAALTSASSTIAKDRSTKLATDQPAQASSAQSQPLGGGVPLRATKQRGGVPVGIVAAIIVILLLVGAVIMVLQKKSDNGDEPNQVAATDQPGQPAANAGAAGAAATGDSPEQGEGATQGGSAEAAEGAEEQAAEMADATDAAAEVAEEQVDDEAAQADEGQQQQAAATPTPSQREEQARQERTRPSSADRAREAAAAAASAERRSAEREREAAQREARAEREERSQGSSNSGSSGSAVDNALAAIERGNDDSGSSAGSSSGGAAAGSELSSGQIRSTVRRYGSRIARCKRSDADAGTYRIGVVIQPDGSVSSVEGQSDEPNQCIARVASGMRFPAFSGDAKAIRIPFVIH